MTAEVGQLVLQGKYRLIEGPLVRDDVSTSWKGEGVKDNEQYKKYLVKVWPFEGDSPDPLKHALWLHELRVLYRVSSSPGAEDSVLIIRDARLDRDARCFVVVAEAVRSFGYTPLSEALKDRQQYDWLCNANVQARCDLWRGLKRIADGLHLLHEQNTLHRNLGVEAVFFDTEVGTDSLRLGGFEWSIRLGHSVAGAPGASWATPPEMFSGVAVGHRPETDWYGFGMLAVRCLLNVETAASLPVPQRHERVVREIERATNRSLSDLERTFLRGLIDADPSSRVRRGDQVRATLKEILVDLVRGTAVGGGDRPLVLAIDPDNTDLIDRAREAGYVPDPDPDKKNAPYNSRNISHSTRLTQFIQQDLARAKCYGVPSRAGVGSSSGDALYVLVGQQYFTLILGKFSFIDRTADSTTPKEEGSWDVAFCRKTGHVSVNEWCSEWSTLPENKIIVRTVAQVHRDRLRSGAQNWERYLPVPDRGAKLRAELARFHEFIRCTNQLELLIRDAEIFRYRTIKEDRSSPGLHRLVIEESKRDRPPAPWCAITGGLVEHLQREIDSGKSDCDQVVLTTLEEDGLEISRRVPRPEFWKARILLDGRQIELERSSIGEPLPAPPPEGTIRTVGMFGQVKLIQRRTRAIRRLEKHTYLLRALCEPSGVWMDTGPVQLPVPLEQGAVDERKQEVLKDVLRVHPIYALQGPPGTGKTTLVSHLIRQILKDDEVAQILITAQAHPAVDLLRKKIRDEAFQGVEPPLAVRLGSDHPSELADDSVEQVALRELEKVRAKLGQPSGRLQQEWLAAVAEMVDRIERRKFQEAGISDFLRLVGRGASLTYCTTTAGDLEELADGAQSFDWSIIEEAGKVHGFELALPLQAGHRWLLIGDPYQLPPYRIDDYQQSIDRLDDAVAWLEKLPSARLIDRVWVRAWGDRSDEIRRAFKVYATDRLKTFDRILTDCSSAVDETVRRTVDESNGSMAGLLSKQYRMHPAIGDLISTAYYDDELVSATRDEATRQPLPRVVHPFVRPAGVEGKAIVWIDLPWAERDSSCEEQGEGRRVGGPRYRNEKEVDAIKAFIGHQLQANDEFLRGLPPGDHHQDSGRLTLTVLSPYTQQVRYINSELRNFRLPQGLVLKEPHRRRRNAGSSGNDDGRRPAHTVDSFQGNEADIVVVSLVRNNTLEPGNESAIGFLAESYRLNVLLSRAEQLLVLVGSWEFLWRQVEHVPLDDKRHQKLWHWKKVLTVLDGWFKEGKALKLNAGATEAT